MSTETPERSEQQDLQKVSDLIDSLSILTKAYQIYGLDHPRAHETLQEYRETATRLSTLPGMDCTLIIAFHDGRLYREHVPLPPLRRKEGSQLLAHLERTQMAGFRLKLDCSPAELEELLALMATQPGMSSVLEGCRCFQWIDDEELSSLESSSRCRGSRSSILSNIAELNIDEMLYANAMSTMIDFMDAFAEHDEGDLSKVGFVAKQLVRSLIKEPNRLIPLATLPYHDNFTHYHCLNVSVLTLRAASLVVTNEAQLERVCQAALLHDLGKIDVPLDVLYKPARLSDAEAAIVMQHPVTGARRLARSPEIDPLAAVVAFSHHIKDGGNGYPKVNPSFRMCGVSRLLEVVDIFEALTAHRPYKKGMTASQAFEILYSMPNMESFHPYMDLLVRSIGFNPVGSRVRTADGEVAIVVGHESGDPRKPIIRPVNKDDDGVTLDEPRVAESRTDGDKKTSTSVLAIDSEEDLLAST